MGNRMKLRTPDTFSWSGSTAGDRRGPGQQLWLGGGWCSAWLRVPNNKGDTVTGSDNWGGKERAIRKNIHLEFLPFFASLHCH